MGDDNIDWWEVFPKRRYKRKPGVQPRQPKTKIDEPRTGFFAPRKEKRSIPAYRQSQLEEEREERLEQEFIAQMKQQGRDDILLGDADDYAGAFENWKKHHA